MVNATYEQLFNLWHWYSVLGLLILSLNEGTSTTTAFKIRNIKNMKHVFAQHPIYFAPFKELTVIIIYHGNKYTCFKITYDEI